MSTSIDKNDVVAYSNLNAEFHKDFKEEILEILKPQSAIETKDSFGGTSLKRVEDSIKSAKETLEEK